MTGRHERDEVLHLVCRSPPIRLRAICQYVVLLYMTGERRRCNVSRLSSPLCPTRTTNAISGPSEPTRDFPPGLKSDEADESVTDASHGQSVTPQQNPDLSSKTMRRANVSASHAPCSDPTESPGIYRRRPQR